MNSKQPLRDELPLLLKKLWRFALRLTRNSQDSEDLVQRTCARALEREAQVRAIDSNIGWLYSIMYSIWMNELRSRRNRGRFFTDWNDDFDVRTTGWGSNPETTVHLRQVVAEVERLPQNQKTVMVLTCVEGLSYQEVADVLDVPIGTVMSRLSRARQIIGAKFTDRTVSDDSHDRDSQHY